MKTLRLISLFLTLFFLFHLPVDTHADEEICPEPDVCLDNAVKAYRDGKIEEALQVSIHLSDLSDLSGEFGDHRIAGISSFMAGHIMGQIMLDGADIYLERAISLYPVIGDYALFRLAEIIGQQEDYGRAGDLYKRVYDSYPDSPLEKKSLLKAADSFLASGRMEDARGSYEIYISMYPRDRSIPSALYGIGRSYLLDDNASTAVEYFQKIWIEYPASPVSWTAKKEINSLMESGHDIPPLTPSDSFERREHLYEAGLYKDALTEYKRFLSDSNNVPQAPPGVRPRTLIDRQAKEAYFKIAMSNYKLRRSTEAEDAFESFLYQYPSHSRAPEALYWLTRAYLRQGKEDAFIKASKGYLRRYDNKDRTPEVLYRLGVIYADKKDVERAILYFDRAKRGYPQSSFASDSQWAKGWLLYKEGKLKRALSVFNDILEQGKGSTHVQKTLYWKAKALKKMKDLQGMEKGMCQLCNENSRSFYCLFARHYYDIDCEGVFSNETYVSQRDTKDNENVNPVTLNLFQGLNVMPKQVRHDNREVFSREVIEGVVEPYDDYSPDTIEDEHDIRIRLLFYLGLRDEVIEEIQWLREKRMINRERAITLASIFYIMDEYDKALSILYSNLSRDMLNNRLDVDDKLWRLIYPDAYSNAINRYSSENNLDPSLVYAIIREESWFNEDAVSSAGAIGLMQLMPETAAVIGKDSYYFTILGRESLFDPETNISMGTKFFSDLLSQFNGNIILALAGYNAGPVAVSGWLKNREGLEIDEFIEDIPYRETREYVKKVFKSYIEYSYPRKAVSKISPPLVGGE